MVVPNPIPAAVGVFFGRGPPSAVAVFHRAHQPSVVVVFGIGPPSAVAVFHRAHQPSVVVVFGIGFSLLSELPMEGRN